MERSDQKWRQRVAIASAWLASSLVGVMIAGGLGHAAVRPRCGGPAPAPFSASAVIPGSGQLTAIQGNGLVTVDPSSGLRRSFAAPTATASVLRHVASVPGIGTSYVEDLAGPDKVVLITPSGVVTVPEIGEARHPVWSPSGRVVWSVGTSLRIWSSPTEATQAVPGPSDLPVFSPVFLDEGHVVAVVQEPVTGVLDTAEDELNNLWSLELATGVWTRLTAFAADDDRWSVIRTPVATSDGAIEFIGIYGLASATQPPSFELWSLSGGAATKIRDLPGEMYLAASTPAGRVWSVFSEASGNWRLQVEDRAGRFRDLGCGRTTVDPLAEIDPDLVETPDQARPGHARSIESAAPAGSAEASSLAILVGDFATRSAAEAVAARLGLEFGGEQEVAVVDHGSSPTAVRPGVWAVVVSIGATADPEVELTAFRNIFPEYRGSTWIVSR